MKIEINSHRKIFYVQGEFSGLFPNLKLAFYEKPNKSGGAPSKKLVKSSSKTLAECRTIHTTGDITILPEMNVGELKQSFSDVYCLSIEIFQKNDAHTWQTVPAPENASLKKLNAAVYPNLSDA